MKILDDLHHDLNGVVEELRHREEFLLDTLDAVVALRESLQFLVNGDDLLAAKPEEETGREEEPSAELSDGSAANAALDILRERGEAMELKDIADATDGSHSYWAVASALQCLTANGSVERVHRGVYRAVPS